MKVGIKSWKQCRNYDEKESNMQVTGILLIKNIESFIQCLITS